MRILIALLPAGALAACASPPPPAPIPPVKPVTHASLGVDGLYRAPPGGVRGASASCRAIALREPIRVVDGVASMQTVLAERLEGSIAPDGSLVIEQGKSTLRGQFSGNWFHGTFSRTTCTFFLAYKK